MKKITLTGIMRTGLAALGLGAITYAHAGAEDLVASALSHLPLGGFIDAVSLDDLANMVVTDTKVAQSRNTVTQNIVVLRGEDFDNQPDDHRNLSQLLRYTSGQFVNVLSRNDANWGSYAGLGPKYNSYLLDGLPIDSFVDPMSIDPWALERIEAHKGPASVLYSNYLTMDFAGNETPLAGITNLVLKDRIDSTMTRVQAGYGTNSTFSGRAYHQGRQGNLSYFFGVSGERSDYEQYGKQNSWLQTVNDPDYQKTKVYGKASYAFDRDDHTLSLFAHYTLHEGDMGRPNRNFEHQYGLLNLVYNNQLSQAWHLQIKAGERNYDRQFDNDNYPTSLALSSISETRQRIRPMDVTLSFKHFGNALLTAGADYQTVDYRTESRNNGVVTRENSVDATSHGVYMQEKIQWGDLVLRGGMRRNTIHHDYALLGGQVPTISSMEWSKNLWSMGARYNFSQTFSVYANAGSSFMAPAAKQIGGTVVNPLTDSGQLSNPGLSPETGIGKDLGAEWRPSTSLALGARVFRNTVSGAIVDNVVNTAPSQTQAFNAGNATATGIELDLKHTLSSSVQWFANVTASRTQVSNPTNADQNGTEIPFAPNHIANLGLTARWLGDVHVSAYYQWVGQYFDSTSRSTREAFGNYGVLNVRLQKELLRDAGRTINLFTDLNNLANRQYAMPWGFRDPGFNGFVGVDVRF